MSGADSNAVSDLPQHDWSDLYTGLVERARQLRALGWSDSVVELFVLGEALLVAASLARACMSDDDPTSLLVRQHREWCGQFKSVVGQAWGLRAVGWTYKEIEQSVVCKALLIADRLREGT